jgi:hypothetical protein
MRDLEQVEERISRAEIGAAEISDNIGGLVFRNFNEALQFANVMASSKTGVPAHLRGDTGACLRIVLQAAEWRMSPFGVADKSYFIKDKIAFESQLIHGVVEARAPLQKRLRPSYEGEGPERVCIVTGYIKGEVDPLIYRSPMFKDIPTKNSPLWKGDPDQQQWHYSVRAWARRFVPDVLLGIYSRDELEDGGDHTGPDKAKDVTPKPNLASRLKGNHGAGFKAGHVETETTIDHSADHPADGKAGAAVAVPSEEVVEQSTAVAPAEPMSVPDAMNMGRELKEKGLPLEIPDEINGEPFAPQRDAFVAGYGEAA